jgi:hypothetical protein
MPTGIPLPGDLGELLRQGIETGGNLYTRLMENKNANQLHPSADVANAMYVEQLRQQYGENDPRYINAKRAHELSLSGRESLMGYRDTLNKTAGLRATSPTGKLLAEGQGKGAQDILNQHGGRQDYNLGQTDESSDRKLPLAQEQIEKLKQYYNPQDNALPRKQADDNPRTPEEREVYQRALNKQTSDQPTRTTLLRAENLDKTRHSINPMDLTRFSGLNGSAHYAYEAAKAAAGNPSDEYLAYSQAISSATLMADQMRQFYGDSIQPSAMDRLRHLSNPSTWIKNPKVAQAEWNQLNKILDQETETYKQAGTSPIKLNKIDFKDGQFTIGNNKKIDEERTNEKGKRLKFNLEAGRFE